MSWFSLSWKLNKCNLKIQGLKVQIIGRPAVDGILIHTYCHIIVLSVKLVSVYLFLGGVVTQQFY